MRTARFTGVPAAAIMLVIGAAVIHTKASNAQSPYTAVEIRALVNQYKGDARGPFSSIRWYCTDGTTVGARERCSEPGGIQHAQHRDDAVALARRNAIYLAQILAGTDFADFLDRDAGFSRIKQYQLGGYLFAVDDGWVLRRAQYYRGAFQIEDEEDWGRRFLSWALGRDSLVSTHFFVLREAARTIPHGQGGDLVLQIRTESRIVSDAYPAFMDARVKIHGQPDLTDVDRVREFAIEHRNRLTLELRSRLSRLLTALEEYYAHDSVDALRASHRLLPAESDLTRALGRYIDLAETATSVRRVELLSELILTARQTLLETAQTDRRLVLMDLSLEIERALNEVSAAARPITVGDAATMAVALVRALAGTGHIELREWEILRGHLALPEHDGQMTTAAFAPVVESIRRAVDWSVGTVVAMFESEVNRYISFEPLAAGFIDDRVRSSPLLVLGELSALLSTQLAEQTGRITDVSAGSTSGGLRGINAGVARGELVVEAGDANVIDFQSDKIYALSRAPADLKPVAGILTVTEGSAVSHVQLLARNLGIPNAALTPDALRGLAEAEGTDVFFAVSRGGSVRLKPAASMTDRERALVEQRERSSERIRVSTERMELDETGLSLLHDLRAQDSGRVCGPKAANLGQLSALFPERVAPGFIIPFGVFRQHMAQSMPGTEGSYWSFLESTFAGAESMRSQGLAEDQVDAYVLDRLATLRSAIETMPLLPDFTTALRHRFADAFGSAIGSVAVFIRSDTNMEDLKDFTGAGLNLTVPNVLPESDILAGIRRVWASPYRERGYRWRQRYLLNPEDVYPSLLVLKSVNVDKSGVLITSGIESGDPHDVTVAFNRGVGGAVDGQAAESYLLEDDGADVLLSPAREPTFTLLRPNGGTRIVPTSFNRFILTESDRRQLRDIAESMRNILPDQPGIETAGPFDVELGFLDEHLWLFQVRPFVENRAAGSTAYLTDMDAHRAGGTIDLDDPLPSR